MAADADTRNTVLDLIPQKRPFRFIDEITALDKDRITGRYRFREDEFFYRGHFPDRPITPGVILIEAMAQTGVVGLGLYLLLHQGNTIDDIRKYVTLFAMVDNVDFAGIVSPGEEIIIQGEKIYFRRGNLKTQVSIERANGDHVCAGILTGRGVVLHE